MEARIQIADRFESMKFRRIVTALDSHLTEKSTCPIGQNFSPRQSKSRTAIVVQTSAVALQKLLNVITNLSEQRPWRSGKRFESMALDREKA